MKNLRTQALCLVLLLVPRMAEAGVGVCAEGSVPVRVEVGRVVEVVVEGGVGDLVRSGDPATLKVEHTSGHLFLTPLTDHPAALTIIDSRGGSHALEYIFGQSADQRIVVGECGGSSDGQTGQDAAMHLMRDMVSGRFPDGAAEKLTGTVMFDDGRVRMKAVLVYELPQLSGYVMQVENLLEGPVIVPVERIEFAGLLAVAVKQDILAKAERTDLYMVVRR